ncbi:MAG: PEGA domain-containing protein [bacterium]|nr:PEGA domain-containing protein [bacterium]
MREITLALTACFALVACGPGVVAPGTDDDDDTTIPTCPEPCFGGGDDDGEDPGNGLLSVTLQSLAIEPEGTTVTAEIILDGVPTGTMAPATIALDAGTHEVTVRRDGFVSPTEEITVEQGGTATVQCTLGRDLTGTWEQVEPEPRDALNERFHEATMLLMAEPETFIEPCPTKIWLVGLRRGMCLLQGDAIWFCEPILYPESDEAYQATANGTITEEGRKVEYTFVAETVDQSWEQTYTFLAAP